MFSSRPTKAPAPPQGLKFFISVLAVLSSGLHAANTPPTPVIVSATMRPGTTLMDVIYRVDDPDDPTVRVRALAFVNSTRSFANVLKPVTFREGTGTNLGDAIPANTARVLTWDVGADWNVDLGQVKFEILALDSRGLLPFDWITIPAANDQPALTISKDSPTDAATLNALFWLYADGDPGLTLSNGTLSGTAQSGVFAGAPLANGSTVNIYGRPFCFKRMNLDAATSIETAYANTNARSGLLNTSNWHAANRPWSGIVIISAWGRNDAGQLNFPTSINPINTAIAAGANHSLILRSDGIIVGAGGNHSGQINIPPDLSGVSAIAAGGEYNPISLTPHRGQSLALKSNGTVVGWGSNGTIPQGLLGITAISLGVRHSIALESDGTVVGWGDNGSGRATPPVGLAGVTAVAAGFFHSLALRSNGTVVGWGDNGDGRATAPTNLSGVSAIAGGGDHSLALKSDGTVVAWGNNTEGECTVPAGLTGVTAIGAGENYSVALKSDGSIVAWGTNNFGQLNIPPGLSGVTAISAGHFHVLALKAKAL
jgi:hypothetical protein